MAQTDPPTTPATTAAAPSRRPRDRGAFNGAAVARFRDVEAKLLGLDPDARERPIAPTAVCPAAGDRSARPPSAQVQACCIGGTLRQLLQCSADGVASRVGVASLVIARVSRSYACKRLLKPRLTDLTRARAARSSHQIYARALRSRRCKPARTRKRSQCTDDSRVRSRASAHSRGWVAEAVRATGSSR